MCVITIIHEMDDNKAGLAAAPPRGGKGLGRGGTVYLCQLPLFPAPFGTDTPKSEELDCKSGFAFNQVIKN